MLIWLLLVLLVLAALALLAWKRFRPRRRPPEEIPASPYVCQRCNEKDCHCDPLN
jgi:hypothetical protein